MGTVKTYLRYIWTPLHVGAVTFERRYISAPLHLGAVTFGRHTALHLTLVTFGHRCIWPPLKGVGARGGATRICGSGLTAYGPGLTPSTETLVGALGATLQEG